MTKRDVILIGGATYDVTGRIAGDVNPGDSNPSRIVTSCGGTARNIAENAARIGLSTSFLSALGSDAFSSEIAASCESVGIDISRCHARPGTRAGVYMDVLDRTGELLLAASDLSALETLPPGFFTAAADYIRAHDIVFVDANLPEPALEEIAACVSPDGGARLIGDGVSVAKVPRFRGVLSRMYAVKTNKAELAALAGVPPLATERDLRLAGEKLLAAGVSRVFVTMGAEGSCHMDKGGAIYTPALPVEVRSVTGAGDAFCAAVAYGVRHGLSARDTLSLGAAMSRITLRSLGAVSEEMTAENALAALAPAG